MFPIPWNFPFRKKNGDMSTIGDVIGGAGSELPPHDVGDAGKLLGVNSAGKLEWTDDVSSEIQTLTNKLSDEVETRAKLGAHNLWAFGDVTFTTYKDFDVSNLDNGAYDFYADVVSADTSATTCMVYDATNNQALGYITRGTKQLLQITLNNTNTLRLYSSTSGSLSSGKDASFSNVLLKLASDPSTEFEPYAMTNRELTENATYKKGDTIAISSNPLYLSALFQNSKELRCTIPINKPISASEATVTINSAQVFNNGTNEQISSGLTVTANKVDGVGLYIIIDNEVDFTTFTAFANAIIRFNNVSIAFT